MPIVKYESQLGQDIIKPLDMLGGIPPEFRLPEITGAVGSGDFAMKDIYEKDFPEKSSALSNVAGQFGVAGVSMGVGIPSSDNLWQGATGLITQLPEDLKQSFEDVLEVIRRDGTSGNAIQLFKEMNLPAEFGTELGSALFETMTEIMGPTMDVVSGIVEAATSWIPILGGFIRGVTSLIRMTGGAPPTYIENEVNVMSFHPDADADFADAYILKPMRGLVTPYAKSRNDLTSIFHPIGTKVNSPTLVKGTQNTSNEIRRITTGSLGLANEKNWVGYIPGSTVLDRGWDISADGKDVTGTRSLGNILPTGSDIATKLWGMMTKAGSPLMYTIDPRYLKKAWADYMWSLRTRIVGDPNDPNWGFFSSEAKANFINCVAGDLYGWAPYPQGEDSLHGNRAREVSVGNPPRAELIDQELSYGIESSKPILSLDNLAQLQKGALDNTPVCAYIDESFPALRFGSDLKEQWQKNRMLLLQHPLRCKVDTDSIPDVAYRNAMINAKQSCGMILSAGPVNLHPNAPKTVAVIQGLSSVGSTGGGSPVDELTGEGSSGKVGLLMAAAVLGLIVMNKKRR